MIHWSWALMIGGIVGLNGCHLAPWKTADADSEQSLWPEAEYVTSTESFPEAEPEPEKTPELSLATARWMEGVGDLIEARRLYEDVVQSHPEKVDALLGLARIDQLSGRPLQAEQGYLAALRLEPNSPVVLHSLGQFYQSQQRWPEAVDALNKAMLAAPTEIRYRHDLAVALVHTGDISGARTHFVRTVGDAAAHYNIGVVLHEMGRSELAEQQMLLAVTKQPDMQHAQYWLDEIRRERESALAVQQSLAGSATPRQPEIRPVGHESFAQPASGHSMSVNPTGPVEALTPQQRQQLLNQR